MSGPTGGAVAPMMSAPTTRATARLLAAGLLVLALLPPAATGLGLALLDRHDARAVAAALAWSLERRPDLSDAAALQSLLATDAPQHDRQVREVLDAQGRVLASAGDEAGSPHTSVLLPVSHGLVHAVRVGSSLEPVLLATAGVALLSCALAGLAWALFVRRSVRALRRAEGQMRTITLIDPLTGLLNRAGLRQRMQRALTGEAAGARRAGLLLIDLDRFHLINDSLGQRAGDQLLRAVAQRIRGVLRQGDAAARLGGDQFVVFSHVLSGEQSASVMARNLLRAIEPVLALGEHETSVSVSIGIALADGPNPDPDPLLAQADAAMRAAKSGGGGRARVFEPSMLANTGKQLELDMAMRRALQAGEFGLVYQPIVAGDGETVQAVEVLLRWNDPARGAVSPAEFIPVLEQTGLIVPVGQWVLREACRRVQGWISQGAAPVVLSVNVSPMQFAEADFVRHVLSALRATGLSPQLLQLEVTEGLLLDPTPEALRKIDALTDAGVRLAVDDFGMGYSSLAYLKRFRLHSLKIDREFVRDVPRVGQDTAIVRAIVELGHALGLHVTAEGVETAEQRDALRQLGCDSLQGFLFARPMSAEAMRERLVVDDLLVRSGESVPADWSTTMAAELDMSLKG